MATLYGDRCFTAELRYTSLAERCENVFSFKLVVPNYPEACQVLADGMATFWNTYLRTRQKSGVMLRETYVTDLSSDEGPTYTSFLYSGNVGTGGSGNQMPNNVTLCITLKTGLRGRSYRGRSYAIGLSDGDVSGQTVTSTYRNLLLTVYARLLPGGGSCPDGFVWSVFSRQHNNVKRLAISSTPILTVGVFDDSTDSMRSRLTGRGR